MHSFLHSALTAAPVIPLIQATDVRTALATAAALEAGGISVVEVVQRTDAALDCLEAIAAAHAGLVVGAGTVLSAEQARRCIGHGARFIVSPGLDEAVVAAAQRQDIDALPGIMTPSEIQHAMRLGLGVVKFFPAATAGGPAAISAMAAAFRTVRFVPTGGITVTSLASYLELSAVIACGGSWLTPADAIGNRNFTRVSELAREALAIAAGAGSTAKEKS